MAKIRNSAQGKFHKRLFFNQKFFNDLNEAKGIALENIVYYKDEVHYFVMTAKKESLLASGVLKEDIPDDDLPWAQVGVPVTEDGSSGQGANSQLKIRAQVFGVFLDGKNSQLPLVLGSIPKIETNTNSIDESLPSVSIPIDGNTNIEKAFNFFISPEGGQFTPQQEIGRAHV